MESDNRRKVEARFPERVYTDKEIQLARKLIGENYKHRLKVAGKSMFRKRVEKTLSLMRIAGYYDFFRTYIRSVIEIDGIGQLREYEAAIWANVYNVDDPVEGARFLIQKAYQMKSYLEGNPYHEYGEVMAIQKSLEFLEELKKESKNDDLRKRCEEALRTWKGYGPM